MSPLFALSNPFPGRILGYDHPSTHARNPRSLPSALEREIETLADAHMVTEFFDRQSGFFDIHS
jgi:hypothetical protein